MDTKMRFGRRDLVKGFAGASIGAALLKPQQVLADYGKPWWSNSNPKELMGHPQISGRPTQEEFWLQVRQAFPLPPRGEYFHYNTGTTGSQPYYSINNLAVYNMYRSNDPVFWEMNLAEDARADLFQIPTGQTSAILDKQAQIAEMYGANPDEIVLSYNTTDGLIVIFTGTQWGPNDRIVTTNMEHPAGQGEVAWARDVFGVNVQVVDIPFDGGFNMSVDQFVELFRPALSVPLPKGGKQYLSFSEISFRTGFVMPVKALTSLAHSFENTWVIVDTAHGWGQLPINCHDSGADFIAGAGHKWLCGGPGTGILYIRNSSGTYPRAPFNWPSEGWGDYFTIPSARYNAHPPPGTTYQGRGDWNRVAAYAMCDSARFFNYIGLRNIYNRGLRNAAYLQQKIIDRWGPDALWIDPSVDQRFKGFVVTFNPFQGKEDPGRFMEQNTALAKVVSNLQRSTNDDLNPDGATPIYLAERNWANQNSDGAVNRCCIRVSTHAPYTSNEETDYVFDQIVREVDATGIPQLPYLSAVNKVRAVRRD